MKAINLRFIYLYLFSAVGLIIIIFGLIQGINLAIKSVFFKDADSYSSFYPIYPGEQQKLTVEEIDQQKRDFEENRKVELTRARQREFSNTIAMIVVGVPVYLYHWKLIQKDNAKG